MKTIRRLTATMLLALFLCVSAYAGDTPGDMGAGGSASPAPGDMGAGGSANPAPGDMGNGGSAALAMMMQLIFDSLGR